MDETVKTMRALARVCVRRMEHVYGKDRLTKKGQQERDSATVEFLAGAWSLAVIEHGEEAPLSKHIGNVTCLLAAIRGYAEVERIAQQEDTPADPVAEMIHGHNLAAISRQ